MHTAGVSCVWYVYLCGLWIHTHSPYAQAHTLAKLISRMLQGATYHRHWTSPPPKMCFCFLWNSRSWQVCDDVWLLSREHQSFYWYLLGLLSVKTHERKRRKERNRKKMTLYIEINIFNLSKKKIGTRHFTRHFVKCLVISISGEKLFWLRVMTTTLSFKVWHRLCSWNVIEQFFSCSPPHSPVICFSVWVESGGEGVK